MSHLNADLAYIAHGDRRYPAVFVSRCHTCRSPHRVAIERLLVDGVPPRTIVERLPSDCGVSAQSVKRHLARNHLPIDSEMVRQRQQIRAEDRWEALGLAATTWQAERADLAEQVRERCDALLLSGDLTLSASTLLRAARFLYDIENDARQEDDDQQRVDRLVQQSIDELRQIFEIAGEIGGDQLKHEMIRRACHDTVTEIIMLDDRFVELRDAAYLDTEDQPHFSQLPRSDLGHHGRVDDMIKVAA